MAVDITNDVRRSLIRLTFATVALAPAVYGLVCGVLWLRDAIPASAVWKARLIFLIGLEAAYVLAVAASLIGGLACALWLLRNSPRAKRVPVFRIMLVFFSVLLALGVAEAASAIWQYRARRASAMPIGGLRARRSQNATRAAAARFLRPPTPVDPAVDFPDPPNDRDIDVVTIGESTAEGVPIQKWLSIDRIVAWQLQQVIPERPIHLMSLAYSGDTLEQQHKKLEQLTRRPDLLIVLCGHNEFKARYAPTRIRDFYFTDKLPTLPTRLLNGIEDVSPLCSLIAESAEKCRISIPPSPSLERDLIDVPVYSDAEFAIILADFQRRLDAIVTYAEQVRAVPILIVPAANDAGYEPNRSFVSAFTPQNQREAFRNEFLAARRLEETDVAAGIARYRRLLQNQPGFAETHYRLARLLVQAGAPDEAYRHFILARDNDGYPMRCLTAFQDAYREVASRHRCILIDTQAYLHRIGHQGLLDDELFQDMMHPSLRGYIALSQAVLRALAGRRAFGWPMSVPAPVIDPARCAAHFGLGEDAWKHLCAWQEGFNELVIPIRHDQRMRQQKRMAGLIAAGRLSAGMAPEALGLPNLGIPAPIPMVPFGATERDDADQASVP
jgi:lysophospholipase L1-like esterase